MVFMFSINVTSTRKGSPGFLPVCTALIVSFQLAYGYVVFCHADKGQAETFTAGQILSIKKEQRNPTPVEECTQSLLLFLVTYSSPFV